MEYSPLPTSVDIDHRIWYPWWKYQVRRKNTGLLFSCWIKKVWAPTSAGSGAVQPALTQLGHARTNRPILRWHTCITVLLPGWVVEGVPQVPIWYSIAPDRYRYQMGNLHTDPFIRPLSHLSLNVWKLTWLYVKSEGWSWSSSSQGQSLHSQSDGMDRKWCATDMTSFPSGQFFWKAIWRRVNGLVSPVERSSKGIRTIELPMRR